MDEFLGYQSNRPLFGAGRSTHQDWMVRTEALVDAGPGPAEVLEHVRAWHNADTGLLSDASVSRRWAFDALVDRLVLGQDTQEYEGAIGRENLDQEHSGETLWLGGGRGIWTSYMTIKGIVRALELTKQDTLYDLGAGYCRLPVYAGITTSATSKGLEILHERTSLARNAVQKLGLDNVSFVHGNVLEQDYSDGNVFFMFLPFSGATFRAVRSRLHEIAREKPIRIVARGGELNFMGQPWLEDITSGQIAARTGYGVHIFASNLV